MARTLKYSIEADANGLVQAARRGDAELDRLDRTAKRTKASAGMLGQAFSVALGTMAAAAAMKLAASLGQLVRGGIRLLNDSVQAAGIQLIAERKLEQALRNMGEAAPDTAERLKTLAAELQRTSNFGDEAIITAQAMLLTFKEVAGSEGVALLTPRLADMAAGLADASGQAASLNTVAQAVGKALTGGAGALSRYGVSLSEAQREAFNAATGLDRVRMLTEILDDNFAGLAQATRDPFKQMSNAVGDLREKLGVGLRKALTDVSDDVQELVQSGDVEKLATDIGDYLGGAITDVWEFLKSNSGTFRELGGEFVDLADNVDDLAAAIGRLGGQGGEYGFSDLISDAFAGAVSLFDALNEEIAFAVELVDRLVGRFNTLAGVAGRVTALPPGFENMTPNELRALMTSGGQGMVASHGSAQPAPTPPPPPPPPGGGGSSGPAPAAPGIPVAGSPTGAALTDKERLDLMLAEAEAQREINASLGDAFPLWEVLLGYKMQEIAATHEQITAQYEAAEATAAASRQQEALAFAIEQTIAQQMAQADTAIKSADDVANAFAQAARKQIQAALATAIAKSLASAGPAALILGPGIAAGLNLLFNALIPRFEQGVTGFRGGLAIVGEAGPELVSLPGGANVLTNANTEALMARDTGLSREMLRELRLTREAFLKKEWALRGTDMETSSSRTARLYARAGIR